MRCPAAVIRQENRDNVIGNCAEFARLGDRDLVYDLLSENKISSVWIIDAAGRRLITSGEAADMLMILRASWLERMLWKFWNIFK